MGPTSQRDKEVGPADRQRRGGELAGFRCWASLLGRCERERAGRAGKAAAQEARPSWAARAKIKGGREKNKTPFLFS